MLPPLLPMLPPHSPQAVIIGRGAGGDSDESDREYPLRLLRVLRVL